MVYNNCAHTGGNQGLLRMQNVQFAVPELLSFTLSVFSRIIDIVIRKVVHTYIEGYQLEIDKNC